MKAVAKAKMMTHLIKRLLVLRSRSRSARRSLRVETAANLLVEISPLVETSRPVETKTNLLVVTSRPVGTSPPEETNPPDLIQKLP